MWRTRGFEPPTPENLLYQQQAKLMHHTGSSTETVMQAEDLKAVRLSSDGGEVGVVSEDSFGAGHWGINELMDLRGSVCELGMMVSAGQNLESPGRWTSGHV